MIASGSSERGLSDVTIDDVGELGGDPAHQRPLAAVAVAAGAEDDDHAPVAELRAPRRALSRASPACARSRRDGERLALVDRLEPARDAVDARDPGGDRVLVEVEQEPGRDRAEDVLDVEAPAQRRLDLDARRAEPAPVRVELEPLRPDLGVVGEPERDERRAVRGRRARRRAGAPTRRRRSRRQAAAARR